MTTEWLHGFIAALCVVFVGATFAVLVLDQLNKREENKRLNKVLELAERKTGKEVRA